jgi:glycosyltransferase involved in cell wall biosynthesis
MNKIDIIHAHVSYPAGYIAYLLSKEFDIPYVITEHMSPFPFPEYIKDKKVINELNISLYNASKIIAVSEDLKKDIEQYGFKNIEVIPNFIDETRYRVEDKIQNTKFTF